MLGHISKFDGNNSLIKHGVVQGNNIVDFDLLRNFNGGPGLNRENFIYISNIFLNIKQRNEKNHSINMFREVSISGDIVSVKFYRNEKIECACDFMMAKDAQGYIDLSELDLTSCHFKGDVISKVSFISSNLQHVTFECKEIGDCNFTTAIVDNVIFKCRRLHNVIFIKASGDYVDFSKNILDTVDFSQSQLTHSNFCECQIRNSNFDHCYLYASHFTRAEFLTDKEISFIKSNLTAVMFDHVRISTGNFKDSVTQLMVLSIDYSDIFGNEYLDGYINNIIKMIDSLPDDPAILKSVLAVKLVMQLKILNIVNKNFIENMKKIFSHGPYIKDPIIRSYIHPDE
ncbi:SopA family protein, partial [Escherichia coli]|nr:SopA family protein [Escherichia coli]